MTQEQLGERVGVTKKAISKLERGETKSPTPAHLRKLASALQVDQNWLLDGGSPSKVQEPQTAYAADPRAQRVLELWEWLTEEQKNEVFRDLEKAKRSNEQALELLERRQAKI